MGQIITVGYTLHDNYDAEFVFIKVEINKGKYVSIGNIYI